MLPTEQLHDEMPDHLCLAETRSEIGDVPVEA
jgi:hypothetical protein